MPSMVEETTWRTVANSKNYQKKGVLLISEGWIIMSWKITKSPKEWEKKHAVLVVVSDIVYFYPYLGKWSNLTNVFQVGWSHQFVIYFVTILCNKVLKITTTTTRFAQVFFKRLRSLDPTFPVTFERCESCEFLGWNWIYGQKWWPNRLRSSSSYAYLTGLDILIFQSNIPSILERKTYSEIFWRYILVLFSYAL